MIILNPFIGLCLCLVMLSLPNVRVCYSLKCSEFIWIAKLLHFTNSRLHLICDFVVTISTAPGLIANVRHCTFKFQLFGDLESMMRENTKNPVSPHDSTDGEFCCVDARHTNKKGAYRSLNG